MLVSISTTNAGKVPFGKYEGYDLQELVDVDRRYAQWLLNETNLRRDYPDECYDLDFYLRAPKLFKHVGMRH